MSKQVGYAKKVFISIIQIDSLFRLIVSNIPRKYLFRVCCTFEENKT